MRQGLDSGLQNDEHPRPPVLKLANFAVDPGAGGGSPTPGPEGGPSRLGLKLANFAVDPSQNSDAGTWYHRVLVGTNAEGIRSDIFLEQGRRIRESRFRSVGNFLPIRIRIFIIFFSDSDRYGIPIMIQIKAVLWNRNYLLRFRFRFRF